MATSNAGKAKADNAKRSRKIREHKERLRSVLSAHELYVLCEIAVPRTEAAIAS
jgi:hypothetical protein